MSQAARYFVPAFVDHYQAAAYRVIGWTLNPDGSLLAHFAGGHSTPSAHTSLEQLRRDQRELGLGGIREVATREEIR